MRKKFKTLRSPLLRYIKLTNGGFRRVLDYCTMDAKMEEVDLESLFQSDMVQLKPPWVVQPDLPRSSLAGYQKSRARYRCAMGDVPSHQIEYQIRHGRILDAGCIRSCRQDLRNRFGPLTAHGKSSCLQPYVSAENTWRYK